ncbi:glycosyltransferase family 4 protein [Granulicatella seriolae]|uniref:Glycosyltransferase family 4 protein n=1 Tax=Granulicatella seriolae TaxID=2967226 RepID=A0ABT1WPX5_9LACT|nr:glycosyltransferase family 4 protein [Granulicatella seriolae]
MKNSDLRIMMISPLPPPIGGIARWTEQYIHYATNRKMDIRLVNTAIIGERSKIINSKRNILDEIKRTYQIIRQVIKIEREYKPDIIHLNTSCSKLGLFRDYLCALVVKKSSTKLFIHYHCNISDQISGRLQLLILKKMTKLADRRLVLNNDSKTYLLVNSDCESKIIPNFIDNSSIRNHLFVDSGKIKEIIFVGHIQESKGINEIIRVAEAMPDRIFNLVGPKQPSLNEENFPKNVKLLGILSKGDVQKRLKRSHLFLFPTYSEGFSVALLEAMASGLPIITTNVGANVDMLEDKGGIIVPVGDSEKIIEAIHDLDDSEYRQQMSDWNIDKVRRNYTLEGVMEKLFSEYEAVKSVL